MNTEQNNNMLKNQRKVVQAAKRLILKIKNEPACVNDRQTLGRVALDCFYAMSVTEPRSLAERQGEKELLDIGRSLISLLTPREIMELFPMRKIYTEQGCQTLDYFSAIQDLSRINIDAPIGDEVDYLQWDYLLAALLDDDFPSDGMVDDAYHETDDTATVKQRSSKSRDESQGVTFFNLDTFWTAPLGNKEAWYTGQAVAF